MSPRAGATATVCLIGFAALVPVFGVWLVVDEIRVPRSLLYVAQVLSGNWALDYGTSQQYGEIVVTGDRKFIFLSGMLGAITLNIGTLYGIFAAIRKLQLIQKRQSMNPESAFELQLDIALRNVLKVLSANDQYQLKSQVVTAFEEAKSEWQTEALPAFLSENAREKLKRELKKELEAS